MSLIPTPSLEGSSNSMPSLPCLNPHCKSMGKPHPNCRCYSGGEEWQRFSEGGEVHFCSGERAHNESCEYYAGGGLVPESDLPTPDNVVPEEDLPVSLASREVPPEDLPGDAAPESWVEQGKAALEGGAKGVFGAFAPMAEVGLGIATKEDIARREEQYPVTSKAAEAAGFVGSMFTPVGIFGKVGKAAEAAAKAAEIGKVGSVIIKTAVEGAAMAASDEGARYFLKGEDPEHPVGAALLHVGAAGLLGGLTGGAFSFGEGLIGKGINSEAGAKAASKAQEFLFKVGQSHNPAAELGLSAAAASIPAYKTAEKLEEKTGLPVWMTWAPIEAVYTMVGKRAIEKINPLITSAAVKALAENEASGLPNAIHYADKIAKSSRAVSSGVQHFFNFGAKEIAPPASDFLKQKVEEFIEGGQVDQQLQNTIAQQPQNFAKGGVVNSEPSNSFAKIFPSQNMLLNAAKGRISKYLNSLRPVGNAPRAPFDDAPSSKEQRKQYDKALEFAVNPMGILNHVNKGDLTPDHMKHFVSMFPESYKFLSKEMTKQITEAQLKGKKPPYAKRQSMSLFLGADLDSSLSPMALQTIQGMYASKKQALQSAVKKSSAQPKGPSSYLTDEQAREKRMQNQKA